MSTAIHGYKNRKLFGQPLHSTIHDLGSSKTAQNVVLKALSEVTAIPQNIVSVTPSKDGKTLAIEIAGHGAKVGDVLRIYSGVANHLEYDIIEVTNSNVLVIFDTMSVVPAAADTAKVMFYVTSKSDEEGNVNFSPGPTQFIQNGFSVPVTEDTVVPANNKSLPVKSSFRRNGSDQAITEDTATPANNRPLPSSLFINKDGVNIPVKKDTATPANTVGIPVEIVAASGTSINISAGDINVQLSHLGANSDSTRIGDGTNLLAINATNEALVHDTDAVGLLNGIDGKLATIDADTGSIASDASLIKTGVDAVNTKLTAQKTVLDNSDATLTSISTKASTGNASTASIDSKLTATNTKLDAINSAQATQATETTLSAVSGKLPATLGQKVSLASLAVVIASDQSAIPVAPNISRGTGAMDANTTRVTLATDGPMVAAVGNIADTVATTDTGSFSLLAFVKRGLQNWTTLLGRLPASIGQKTVATSLAVTLPSDQAALAVTGSFFQAVQPVSQGTIAGTLTNAKITVGTTAVRATVAGTAPSATRKKLMIKPHKDNTGAIYLGASTVTTANGLEIIGPDRLEFEFDAGDYYVISDLAGQSVEIIEKV